jgi:pyrroloquinoline quinone biosynthesis protein B
MAGAGGSAERLAALRARHKVYIHLNNTNPAFDESSPERGHLASLGIEVGYEGWELEL